MSGWKSADNPHPLGSRLAEAWERGNHAGRNCSIQKPPYQALATRQAFIDGWKAGKAAMEAKRQEARHADL